jgi:hypothetical protein
VSDIRIADSEERCFPSLTSFIHFETGWVLMTASWVVSSRVFMVLSPSVSSASRWPWGWEAKEGGVKVR